MKKHVLLLLLPALVLFVEGCATKYYATNGETIYRTGRNKKGEQLLDRTRSQITFINGCKGCHGKNGSRNSNAIISWPYLSNSSTRSIPYTDSLFFRFLDKDLKSDGTLAITGVHWQLSDNDKKDLIGFLKSLNGR